MDVDTYLESLKPSTMSLGLDRIREMIRHISLPRKRNNILVAGTNGKGSTAALLSSILERASGPIGLFTSPHLLSVHERIRISGVPISREEFHDLVVRHASAANSLGTPPTYFEFLTAAALDHFHRVGTRFNVLEVGLGGRLDATNICDGPVSVITRVAHDHTRILGRTLQQIAGEKAGIIKKGQTVIVGRQRPRVLDVIRKIAAERGARVVAVQDVAKTNVLDVTPEGMTLSIHMDGLEFIAHSRLTGEHQADNIAAAVVASRVLAHPTIETLQRAIASTRWPGRLEYIREGARGLLMDGAHNLDCTRGLARFLKRSPLNRPVRLIFGSAKDKRPVQSLHLLLPHVDEVRLVPVSSLRSWDRPAMEDTISRLHPFPRAEISESACHVLKETHDGGTTLVTGSLYLVAEVMTCLNRSPWQLTTQVLN